MRLALALALLCALVLAPSAEAYKRFPNYKWPSRTIRYYDATGSRYKKEVAAAAQAWNKSGAKVHWSRSKSRGSGVVPITINSKIGAAGLATYFFSGGRWQGKIELQPTLKQGQQSKLAGAGVATQVVVHEMGHIMGLDHETKVCAIMQPVLSGGCKQPTVIWQYRCRLLEKDDVRGGVAIFGGKIGKLGPEFCDAARAPAAPTNLSVAPEPADDEGSGGGVRVTWTTPNGKEISQVGVLRKRDACPTGPTDKDADTVDYETANAGQTQSVVDLTGFPAAGSYCYAVVVYGAFNRPGKLATVMYQYTGPVTAGARPTADFDWTPVNDEGTEVSFSDYSEVDEGSIVSWQWDFADGTSSSERNPTHTFAPGQYTVALTVTDDQGRTDTVNRTVYVDEPIDTGGG